MATDGPDPKPCDSQVLMRGHCVFVTHWMPCIAMDRWVQQISALSGQRVEWNLVLSEAGKARVMFLPSRWLKLLGRFGFRIAERRVEKALWALMPEHDRLMTEAIRKFKDGFSSPAFPRIASGEL